MIVVIAHSIRKKEFKRGEIPHDDLETILDGYAKGIVVTIKGEELPKGSRLVKLYVTTVAGARRIVFLVDVESGTGFFLFYRGKNDALVRTLRSKIPLFGSACCNIPIFYKQISLERTSRHMSLHESVSEHLFQLYTPKNPVHSRQFWKEPRRGAI